MMRIRYKQYTAMLLAALLLFTATAGLTGCDSALPEPATDGVLRVVVTSFPAEEFARALLGDALDGETVVLERLGKAGQDLHAFEPSAADILSISQADLLICLGSYAETWLDKAVTASKNASLRVLSLMDVCDLQEEEVLPGMEDDHHDHDHGHGDHDHDEDREGDHEHEEVVGTQVEYDEHVWTSFHNASRILTAMEGALCELLPSRAAQIGANAAAYRGELDSLHAAYAAVVESSPSRLLVIADRYPFAYLMEELGIVCYAAFPGCSSETQASFSTQVFLTETVSEHDLPAVLYVDYGAGSVASAVSRATGVPVLRLWSGQVESASGLSYLDMVRENLDVLATALQ